jgi:hypothetical protein
MEQQLKQHFGDVDIYRFNGHRSRIGELGIAVNYVIVENEIYFVSEQVSTDIRVELVYPKGTE